MTMGQLQTGDEVMTLGRWYRAERIGDTVILTPIRWWTRLGRWFARHIQFRGFWSRVWDR